MVEEQGIEEARGRCQQAIEDEVHAAVSYVWARGEEMRVRALERRAEANNETDNAIRAYGLAVLASVEMSIIDDAVVEGARAQIKALGKEAE